MSTSLGGWRRRVLETSFVEQAGQPSPVGDGMMLPELTGLDARQGLIRIPPELDVPTTCRVRRLIDTSAFRRLAKISQLGLVALVYPAAHHRRFEHSLGVYRLALLFLNQLRLDSRFASTIRSEGAELLVLAALLHDIGHWPFCHLIEDLHLPHIPSHESFAQRYLLDREISDAIGQDWSVSAVDVADLLAGNTKSPELRLLASILSGPIDVDKMDYLMRDSLHAGVPYGRNFDQARLISSLCLNQAGDGLALTEKGRTAAEMMVFARYVMFSEVYWHHAVRSATAMFQRSFYQLHTKLDLDRLFQLPESDFIGELIRTASTGKHDAAVAEMLDGMFGTTRRLYKRWLECRHFEHPQLYARLARQPYSQLVADSQLIADHLASVLGTPVELNEVLIDAPPAKREVQFDVEIFSAKTGQYRPLVEVSPVVRTLAETQFDDFVKRVRIYVHPRLRTRLEGHDAVETVAGVLM